MLNHVEPLGGSVGLVVSEVRLDAVSGIILFSGSSIDLGYDFL